VWGGERALTLAPPSLALVLATSWPDDQEKLAHASFPPGIKQVMASHPCCCCSSGRGTVAAQEFRRCRHPPKERDGLPAAPSFGGPSLSEPSSWLLAVGRPHPPHLPSLPPAAQANTCRGLGTAPSRKSLLPSFSQRELSGGNGDGGGTGMR
jgi:hypothetical protein